ncbi:hypothetical protein ACFY96_17445 [Streptomyces massasporeus]
MTPDQVSARASRALAAAVDAGRDLGLDVGDAQLATPGPVEWDLAAFGPECEAAYDAAAGCLGLRRLDRDVLRAVNAVGMSRAVACLALAPQLPLLVDALKPFAGRLGA